MIYAKKQLQHMYIIICEIDGQSKFMHEIRHAKLVQGTTQRAGMGREVEGGFGMGDTCIPLADSCQCMAKTTTIL